MTKRLPNELVKERLFQPVCLWAITNAALHMIMRRIFCRVLGLPRFYEHHHQHHEDSSAPHRPDDDSSSNNSSSNRSGNSISRGGSPDSATIVAAPGGRQGHSPVAEGSSSHGVRHCCFQL